MTERYHRLNWTTDTCEVWTQIHAQWPCQFPTQFRLKSVLTNITNINTVSMHWQLWWRVKSTMSAVTYHTELTENAMSLIDARLCCSLLYCVSEVFSRVYHWNDSSSRLHKQHLSLVISVLLRWNPMHIMMQIIKYGTLYTHQKLTIDCLQSHNHSLLCVHCLKNIHNISTVTLYCTVRC